MTNEKVIEQLEAIRSDYRDDLRNFPELVKDDVEALDAAIHALKDLEVCRNELCLRCGQYRERHLGACDGCRWKE